ncbi:hypothetical protein PV08_08173 [Exophiala spinifera]|uniref:Mannosyltransferase n=1 Tax=Exophiala spinifera TaxID=91928 RepID=A0A0D1YDE9_9EURO|nr:uncharacterized protein PV08_08173 [Exophiala spinifera]KIW12986.1 hypothetical protein PV08_08173 [Exophiala spinifera]
MASAQSSSQLDPGPGSRRRLYSPTFSEASTSTNLPSIGDSSHTPTLPNTGPLIAGREPLKRCASSSMQTSARRYLRTYRFWRYVLVTSIGLLLLLLFTGPPNLHNLFATIIPKRRDTGTSHAILQPVGARGDYGNKDNNPVQWLQDHSDFNFHLPGSRTQRPRAALISLVRNEELDGILQSMRDLEFHWNRRYRYPWIFFNEKPFSEEFKAATSNATDAQTEYHVVPHEHWQTPSWIDHHRYMDTLDYLGTISVGKGHMLSYHSMIRWQSLWFYRHPALLSYNWYWRVEPDVHFFCSIPYDPFSFLEQNELVYGFNMAILDDARSFTSLWSVTRAFIERYPELLHPDADLDWLLDPDNGGEYNNCQFFSNFEIASLGFWRSEGPSRYAEWLDEGGGFFYERYGDAPVHTLALAMFAAKQDVWFFRDIGYQHDIARHCPPAGARIPSSPPPPPSPPVSKHDESGSQQRKREHDVDVDVGMGTCACEPSGLDANFYKLVPMESPQVKPADTCIRLWLGGQWLAKKEGWKQDVERAFGGDGYGGYVLDGM